MIWLAEILKAINCESSILVGTFYYKEKALVEAFLGTVKLPEGPLTALINTVPHSICPDGDNKSLHLKYHPQLCNRLQQCTTALRQYQRLPLLHFTGELYFLLFVLNLEIYYGW